MRKLSLFLLFVISLNASAQIGGRSSFEFLHLPPTARLAGLGGVNISLADKDVNFFYSNPALNGDTLAGTASANYQFFVADIGHAAFTYAHDFKRIGVLTMGIRNMSYGSFKGYDASGHQTTDFNANETALVVGKSHQIGNYRLGVSMKGIFSSIAGYRAGGLAFDMGAVFIHPKRQLSIGLAIKDLGFIISNYASGNRSKLPFDVQLGATFKPQHMPLRFTITGFNMTRADVTYHDPAIEEEAAGTLQKILTHVNFGGEILVHQNVNVLVGYNYFNHRALKLENGGGGAGITFGFSASVKNFDFVFSRMAYMAGNAAYSFTLSGNIRKLIKRQ